MNTTVEIRCEDGDWRTDVTISRLHRANAIAEAVEVLLRALPTGERESVLGSLGYYRERS